MVEYLKTSLEAQAGHSVRVEPVACLCSKFNLGAIEGRDNQRATSPILRGPTLIAMMQAANLREGNNVIACGP